MFESAQYVLETIEIGKELVALVEYDEVPESPREWDNMGTIIAWHNRYSLSDKNIDERDDMREFLECSDEVNDKFSTQEGIDEATDKRLMDIFLEKNIVLPVYMYEHSCVALSTGSFYGRAQHAGWDSGQVGYIFVSKEKIRKEFNVKRISKKLIDKVEKILSAEIDTYSKYLNGDVVTVSIMKKDEDDDFVECIESCGGFFGYDYENNGVSDFISEFKN